MDKNKFYDWKFRLFQSVLIRECYTAIDEKNTVEAVYKLHHANNAKLFSILEYHYLKEIIWLGYKCYVDMNTIMTMDETTAKEQRLVDYIQPKIQNLDTGYINVLLQDEINILSRLKITGISESTLKILLRNEIERRNSEKNEKIIENDHKIKKEDISIKQGLFYIAVLNVITLIILALL